MTRKDLVLIANVVSALDVDFDTRAHVANELATALSTTNGRFDRTLFVTACLGTPEVPRELVPVPFTNPLEATP